MIPPDVATSLRAQLPLPQSTAQPAPTQPLVPVQRINDVLSDLVPGQRILAEIQALLPNGAYRATVAQRDVTLALPFSAKPGDSLELEVVDTDGKLSLAFVANRGSAPAESAGNTSVATTFSQTGRLIGDLLAGVNPNSQRAAPAPLNSNQPLLASPPENAATLAPALKEAITQSGVFYEAHQARWVAGNLPKEALLQEPQGKQAPLGQPPAGIPREQPPAGPATAAQLPPGTPTPNLERAAPAADAGMLRTAAPTNIPPDLVPIVQQQLDGLATQNFAWHGQVWPGQTMEWSIEPDASPRSADGETGENWRTTLRLNLPRLGEVSAALQLRPGGDLELSLTAPDETARRQLSLAVATLRRGLEDAGLHLIGFNVADGDQLS